MSENPGRKRARNNIAPMSEAKNNRSPEDREEFIPVVEHLIIQGLNDSEIAREVGIDRKAVAHLRKTARPAKKNPLGMVQRGIENDRVNYEILRLNAEGLTYVQIAEEVGLSWDTVRSRLRKEFAKALESKREEVAGRQVADMEIMRMELLEIIIRSNDDGFDTESFVEMIHEGEFTAAIKKISEKATKTQDAKFKAMETLLKLLEREAKLFNTDADKTVNINHNIKVEPEAIALLNRIEQRNQIDNVIDAEVITDFEMGNPEG